METGFPACKELGSAGAEILNKSMQCMLGIVSCYDENFAVVRKNCKIIVFMPGISIQTVDELFQTDWKIRNGVREVHHAYGIFPVNTESLLGQGNDIKFFLFWKENCVFEPSSSFQNPLFIFRNCKTEDTQTLQMDFPRRQTVENHVRCRK